MQRRAAIEEETPPVADIRADLDAVRSALDRLLRKAEMAGMNRQRRFVRYLETLDRMHREVGELLEQSDDDACVDVAAEGLKEVWARLAIARSAAEARFH
jgi:hypothetical protein